MSTSPLSKVASWIQSHRSIAVGGIILLVLLIVLPFLLFRTRDPRIVYEDLTDEHGHALASYLDTLESPFAENREVLSWDSYQNEERHTGFDLYVGLWENGPTNTPADLASLPEESLSLLPRSLRTIGRVNDEQRALPIAIDHIELLYRRDFFAEAETLIDGRVRELAGLETVAAQYVEPGFFPIVVAGGEDPALLDMISVLSLSLGGVDGYRGLLEALGNLEIGGEMHVFELVTANGWAFSEVSDRLRRWRQAGMLHPEWIAFSEEDAFRFLESQRTVAVVMRLSTHRSWPPYALNRWRSSPFPYQEPGLAGTGLIAPVYVVAVPGDSPWQEEAVATAPIFQGQPFQEEVVQAWRLAPVHSTAEALDRESADLRFWAAASRNILPSLADVLTAEQAAALAAAMRVELVR